LHDSTDIAVNHLLYMDDIKLYSKSESNLLIMITNLNKFSQEIKMNFNASKCNTMAIKKGQPASCKPISLGDNGTIHCLEGPKAKYKYLGIWEADSIKHEEMKIEVKTEYRKRLRQILKSKLNGPNKISGINQYAVPVVRYSAGIIKWSKAEISQLDTGTRKLMTIYGCFARKDDVDRLYVKRIEGGRGLLNIEDAIKSEVRIMSEYISESRNKTLKACQPTNVKVSDPSGVF